MATTQSTSDESLVARIILELEDQPQARMLLLQTLLTEEFLLLPSRMDRLEQELADFNEQTARNFDRVWEAIGSLTAEVRSLGEQVRALGEQVNSLANTVMLQSHRMDTMSGHLSALRGEAQERKVAFKVNSVISQPLGLTRTRVILSIGEVPPRDLLDPIEDAREKDRITDEQFRSILDTDLVFFARRRRIGSAEREPVWCAVEISTTIREDDVDRARKSAEALQTAVGIDTLAIVAGPSINDRAQYLIESEDVLYMRTPVYEPSYYDGSDDG